VALDPAYQLVVAGAGPALRSLQAYAADLEISSRVRFVGPVQEAEIYRWLRTAKVVVAVSEQETSGSLLLEAACAGVPVVASDIPAHREAAWLLDGVGTTLVSPQGSPLDVAEAVSLAEPLGVSWRARLRVPSWDAVVDSTLAIYEELVPHQRREAHAPGDFALSAPRQVNGSVLAFESRRSERS
jgi:glycosyltransferase involved in cell wall biosynthesis